MKKNVSGQKVGVQMVSASDGSAFTGSVTVEVTGDAGTQATGSVGSGACTHEGNGYHTYAPAQAETNYDLIAFTFHGSGAVPATVQVYTSFPQTGDSFARLGAPAGASVSADVAAVKSDSASILSAVDTEVAAILAAVDTEVAAIKAKTDNLPASFPANFASLSITAAGLVAVTSGLKKNAGSQGMAFPMTDSTNHNPTTGLTVTATRSLFNGTSWGSFASMANAVAEIGSTGVYGIVLDAADTNAVAAVYRFTATGADDRDITVVFQP